jgi:hypothetical protein
MPFYSFFTLLETYDLQLHHAGSDLHPPLRDVCGRAPVPSLPHAMLFRKRASPIDGYYFQHKTKGPDVYVVALPSASGTAGGMIG